MGIAPAPPAAPGPAPADCSASLHRCLVCLGDLCRYQVHLACFPALTAFSPGCTPAPADGLQPDPPLPPHAVSRSTRSQRRSVTGRSAVTCTGLLPASIRQVLLYLAGWLTGLLGGNSDGQKAMRASHVRDTIVSMRASHVCDTIVSLCFHHTAHRPSPNQLQAAAPSTSWRCSLRMRPMTWPPPFTTSGELTGAVMLAQLATFLVWLAA